MILDTDQAIRKRSLEHPDMPAMEALCKRLVGEEIILDALPGWDPQFWFWSVRKTDR